MIRLFLRMKLISNSANNDKENNVKFKNDEDAMDNFTINKGLSYAVSSKSVNKLSIPIDEPIIEPRYYREVCHAIANTSEYDQVEFEIASPGGHLEGLQVLLTAIAKTEATSVAYINGPCHSAASILALHCDVIHVSPYASMLVHFVSYGAIGKAVDIALKVDHVQQICQELFQETYEGFLTPDEINNCLHGYELWLDAEEIQKRLARKLKLEENRSTAQPKRKASPRKKTPELVPK